MPNSRRLTVLTIVALTGSVGAAQQDPKAAAAEALARPLTAGSVPFLLPHARYVGVANRLLEALRHDRADVRAVAARGIWILGGAYYGDAVAAALAAEGDPIAAAEMVRALLAIRGAAADTDALAAVKRFGAPVANAVNVTFAHTRPLDALAHLPILDADGESLTHALLRALVLDAERVAVAVQTLPAGVDPDALIGLFDRSRVLGVSLPPRVIEWALARTPSMRNAALLYLVGDRGATAAVAAATASIANDGPTGWTAVLLELLKRSGSEPAATDLVTLIPALDRKVPTGFWMSSAVQRLSTAELRALRAHVLGGQLPGVPPAPARADGTRDLRWYDRGLWRTAEPLLPGIDNAVAEAVGCRQGRHQVAVLDITYGNRGQPRNVQISGGSASTECRQAAAGLALLEISPVGEARPDERTDHVVAVFSRDAVDCEGLAARRQPTRSVVAEGITEPRKIRDVKPVYPPDAVAARVQGKVFVEATIDRSGCVGKMWVIEPAHPMLMVEALVAVRQWRFTPTLLNGEAVPVRMTVTVNFTLN